LAATPSEIAGLGKEIEFYVGKSEVEKGGPGSGHWGHKGRKGRRGGSAPSKAPAVVGKVSTVDWTDDNYRSKFEEATGGHRVGSRVTKNQATEIAYSLQGMPQPDTEVTFITTKTQEEFDRVYGGSARGCAGFYRVYTDEIVFGPQTSANLDTPQGFASYGTVWHEWGHALDYTLSETKGVAKSSKVIRAKDNPYDRAWLFDRFPTNYAKKTEREFFAESIECVKRYSNKREVGFYKHYFPESHEMVGAVLGDRMPEEWK